MTKIPNPRSYPRESALHQLQFQIRETPPRWEFNKETAKQAKFVAKWNALLANREHDSREHDTK
jgi:hypothetical protein